MERKLDIKKEAVFRVILIFKKSQLWLLKPWKCHLEPSNLFVSVLEYIKKGEKRVQEEENIG